jgi:hypothetical protein
LKFVDPDWSANGDPCNGRELICHDRHYEAVRWGDGDGGPLDVKPVLRDQPLPDIKAWNAEIPKEQWRMGLNGQPEPPWQIQRVLEFLDPESAERFSWPHNVKVAGSSRAAEELEGRIRIVRRLRGETVYPRVRLDHTFMPTKFGGRERPFLRIVGWVKFGESGGLVGVESNILPENKPKLVGGTVAAKPVVPTQSVSEPTLSEEMDGDVVPF